MHSYSGFLISSLSLSILIGAAGSAEFSKREWANPAQAGSSIWIKNKRDHAVALDTLYVSDIGFQNYGEVAFNAGGKRVYFAVEKTRKVRSGGKRGKWARLIPRSGKRVWVRARDSLLLSGFECGSRLQPGRKSKQAVEDFVLDLKLVDNWGDSSKVKVTQLAPRYYIDDNPGMVDSGPREE